MNKVNDIRPVKNKLRKAAKEYRTALSKSEKEKLDRKIENKFLNMWQYREANTLLIYVSTDIEVDTTYIIKTALNDGKKVAVPKCIDGTRNMEFYFIDGFSRLESGTFGVFEPKTEECEKLEDFSNGLCVVPALMFDKAGYRLGFGKGYYDRFLAKFSGQTLGLCYNACLKEALPHGKYDKRVEKLVTQSKIIITNEPKGGRTR